MASAAAAFARPIGGLGRDPRAARSSIRKNVTTSESCEFYGVQDAISKCRYPRSCRDCLKMPGCMIGEMRGACMPASTPYYTYGSEVDYRNVSLPSAPHGTAFNKSVAQLKNTPQSGVFFSANATYCGTSDPICTQCRATFQAAAESSVTVAYLASQYCVGVDGCVCIASCEVPNYREKWVYDTMCGQDAPVFVPHKPKPLQPFTTVKRDPRAASHDLTRCTTTDTCEHYPFQDVRGCPQPRTCQDCLLRDGCMVSNNRCQSIDGYGSTKDFRADNNSGSLSVFYSFPSTNTTYCPLDDATRTQCRKEFQRRDAGYTSVDSTYDYVSTFCIGDGGCVCIEACESVRWASRVVQATCRNQPQVNGTLPEYLVSFGIAVAVWFVLFVGYKISKYERRRLQQVAVETAAAVWRHMLDQAPALRLDLFGWRRYYQRLQYKERQLLEGFDQELSPVTHPINFDFAEPSAPDFDEDESSAPTATDPRALASAPVYRRHPHEYDDVDASVATAPNYEDE